MRYKLFQNCKFQFDKQFLYNGKQIICLYYRLKSNCELLKIRQPLPVPDELSSPVQTKVCCNPPTKCTLL